LPEHSRKLEKLRTRRRPADARYGAHAVTIAHPTRKLRATIVPCACQAWARMRNWDDVSKGKIKFKM